MICEKHPERAGTLAVDCPSISVRRFLCDECRAALIASLKLIPRVKDEWERGSDWSKSGDAYYFNGVLADNPRNEGRPTYSERGTRK